jgi:organic radical activating enzyme
MSEYNNNADIAEKQLKFISPTMCYAKWAQVSLHLTNGMTNSCYHPPLHKIAVEDIKRDPSELHNTPQKKSERKMMLNGERPSGCSYCWRIEDSGSRSDRIYRSGEYWAQNARQDILSALDTENITPRYVEVNFNQACNFKCMYCSPHLSTSWEDEIKKHGPYDVYNEEGVRSKHNDVEYLEKEGLMPLRVRQDENPYLEAFWKWWPDLYKKLEVFRMTGGEPLMDVNTYRVLDYVCEHPNAWLEMSVTTNMCPPKQELFDKFLDKVKKLEEIQIWEDKERFNPGSGNHWYVNMALKNFALFISLDSVGEQAEYIRSGLEFSRMHENTVRFLQETNNTTVTFINTFNALSVPKIKDFMKYILELRGMFNKDIQGTKYIPIHDPYYKHPDYQVKPVQKIWFDIPLLRYPSWQSVQILGEEYEQYLEETIVFMRNHPTDWDSNNFAGFYDFEIDKLVRNLKIMREQRFSGKTMDIAKTNFKKFFEEYDKRKDKSFVSIFPELADLYK